MNKHSLILIFIMFILLAACNQTEESGSTVLPPVSSTPSGATPAPPATRVVTRTPQPTQTPSPAPTLNETLLPLQDSHNLIMRYTVTESPFVEEIIYAASGVVTIDLAGQISGEGEFSPTLSYEGSCLISVEHGDVLKFQITGNVNTSENALTAEIQLIPLDSQASERYVITCYPDPRAAPEITTIEQPILWRALAAAGLLNLTFDLSQPNNLQSVELSLTEVSNGAIEGVLVGEIYFGR